MGESDLEGVREDLHNLYSVLAGIVLELNAVKMILRAAVKAQTGEDPLKGTIHEDNHDGGAPAGLTTDVRRG